MAGNKKRLIISLALIELGFSFRDEDLEEESTYQIADKVLDQIVKEFEANSGLTYNLRYEIPNKAEKQDIPDRVLYIKNDKMTKIMTPRVTVYGHLIASRGELKVIEYLEKTSLEEIPEEYTRLLTLALCIRIAGATGKKDALDVVYQEYQIELSKMLVFENVELEPAGEYII